MKMISFPQVMIVVNSTEIKAIFDTGASQRLLHKTVYRSLPPYIQLASAETSVTFFDVHNKQLTTLGKVKLKIRYSEQVLKQELIVTNGITEMCILGIDAILKQDFVLCVKTKAIYIAYKDGGDRSTYHREYKIGTVKEEILLLRPTSEPLVLGCTSLSIRIGMIYLVQ
jgi:hypothetical protein